MLRHLFFVDIIVNHSGHFLSKQSSIHFCFVHVINNRIVAFQWTCATTHVIFAMTLFFFKFNYYFSFFNFLLLFIVICWTCLCSEQKNSMYIFHFYKWLWLRNFGLDFGDRKLIMICISEFLMESVLSTKSAHILCYGTYGVSSILMSSA